MVKIVCFCPGCTDRIIGKCMVTVLLELKTYPREKDFISMCNKKHVKYYKFNNMHTYYE